MNQPNFIIIGAAKCGTSTLYHATKQHPQVFMSATKEPKYFCAIGPDGNGKPPHDLTHMTYWVDQPADYEALFAGSESFVARGEASTYYLPCAYAIRNIKRSIPEAKLLVILRDPISRAFSHYVMDVREGRERRPTFAEVARAEISHMNDEPLDQHAYLRWGLYHRQLQVVYDNFPESQVLVLLQEDLRKDLAVALAKVYGHIGVATDFVPDQEDRNVGYALKSVWVADAIDKPNIAKRVAQAVLPKRLRYKMYTRLKTVNRQKAELDPALRAELLPRFREDTLALQEMLGRDLSRWLS